MTPQSIFSRRPGTETTRLGADFVVLDPEGRTLRGLNPTGARVFELLDGQRDASALAREIAREYQLSPERALTDVLGFLEVLGARGLLRAHSASTAAPEVIR